MALVALDRGVHWPFSRQEHNIIATTNLTTLDATAEKVAFIGHLFVEGRNASPHTISGAGGGSISWKAGTVTFADGSSTFEIGIQDVDVTTGAPVRPDGTFDVSAQLTGGGGGITTAVWNTTDMTQGTKTLTHGDRIAVVFDFTNRAGSDSVIVTSANALAGGINGPVQFLTGSWAQGSGNSSVVIAFDDGVLGVIDLGFPILSSSNTNFTDATNPDEVGILFQVPFDCKIDGIVPYTGSIDATTALIVTLYADPLGTPTAVVGPTTYEAEAMAGPNVSAPSPILLATEVSLTKNTDYCLALRATGAGNTPYSLVNLGHADHRKFYQGGTTLARVSRNNGSGSFSSTSTTSIPLHSVRISQVDDGTGTGSGSGMVFGG
jgi:hypothetical protein